MNTITANQLKTKGVSVIENNLAENHELVITVRGKEKFVVMDMKKYNYLRECELEAALHQTEADYHDGNFVAESVEVCIPMKPDTDSNNLRTPIPIQSGHPFRSKADTPQLEQSDAEKFVNASRYF